MNSIGSVKPLPGFSALLDGNLSCNIKPRNGLPIKAVATGSQQSTLTTTVSNNGNNATLIIPNRFIERPILANGHSEKSESSLSQIGNSTNIQWHECSIGKNERQKVLNQKGCLIWITGLSGSGKSTVACALSQMLYQRGKLTYILDGDNLRHGLNNDLGFSAEDRTENIRRVGEVGKLFADAGIICIACLISPYRKDRDACRKYFPDGDFIEVFMDVPIQICESRDPKGLYKLARAGKIKGFTGIDDPYEPPLNCEITLKFDNASPCEMAEKVISHMEENGYLEA